MENATNNVLSNGTRPFQVFHKLEPHVRGNWGPRAAGRMRTADAFIARDATHGRVCCLRAETSGYQEPWRWSPRRRLRDLEELHHVMPPLAVEFAPGAPYKGISLRPRDFTFAS